MLLLRLCLVLAILAGIGVIVVSQVVLKPQIEGIISTRDTHEKNWKTAVTVTNKLNKELKDTQVKLKSTESQLADTKSALDSTAKALQDEKEKNRTLAAAIEKLKADLKAASDELAAWKALGYTVDQIAGVIKERSEFKSLNETLQEENKLFAKQVTQLKAVIDDLRGENVDPPMPPSARGKVLVVDPRWDFLVLDVGSSLGVRDRGVLLVERNGALIAKVRVMSVQTNRSIANILPGWKLKDVMEGDLVFPYTPTSTF